MRWWRAQAEPDEAYDLCDVNPADYPERVLALLDFTAGKWMYFLYADRDHDQPWEALTEEQARWILAHPEEVYMELLL